MVLYNKPYREDLRYSIERTFDKYKDGLTESRKTRTLILLLKFCLQTFSEQNLRYLIVFKIPALNFLNNFVVVTESQLLLYYADILVIDHFYAMFAEKVL